VTGLLIAIAMQAVVAHVTVAQGSASLITEPREVVVRSTEEWQALWKAHSPQAVPQVDFTGSIVVGVWLGSRPTSGFRAEVVAVRVEGNAAIVEYRERAPEPGSVLAQVLTSPFHLVRVSGNPAVVEFRRLQAAERRNLP
jgi:hypothetical protein